VKKKPFVKWQMLQGQDDSENFKMERDELGGRWVESGGKLGIDLGIKKHYPKHNGGTPQQESGQR